MELYPMTFKPILKKIIWGGNDICPFKELSPVQDGIGESWELSHVDGNYSVVAEGTFADCSIDELIKKAGPQLVGEKVMKQFGTRFPLLIKFIDARRDLSIQVHPNDELARQRHNSFGKTEMWYVIRASEGACLYSGFSKQIDGDEYVRRISEKSFMEVLKKYEVKAGDVFFLPAGRVHAIGAGCFITEIQQTSDITYRIYDYDRLGADGKPRELHTELAKDAIDYTLYSDYQTHYDSELNEAVNLAKCKYFTTNLLELTYPISRDFSSLDSFVVEICMEGKTILNDDKGHSLSIHQGQTVLIPADTKEITLVPDGTCKLLETYIA